MKKAEKIDALKKLKAFVKSDSFPQIFTNGLCASACDLNSSGKITDAQMTFLVGPFRKTNTKKYGYFRWERGVKAPRIKWINEQIKKLEKK